MFAALLSLQLQSLLRGPQQEIPVCFLMKIHTGFKLDKDDESLDKDLSYHFSCWMSANQI